MAVTGADQGGNYANFIHLRAHSAYSLLEGAMHIKKLPDLCAKYGMPALALTDTGNLFGALEFSETMAKAGIQPIIGCALALRTDDEAATAGIGANPAKSEPRYLVLLAQSERGYVNLMRLTSMAFLDAPAGDVPHVKLSALSGVTDDLIALTGGAEGPVGALVQAGQMPAARALMGQLADLFPNRLYVELQRHGLPGEIAAEPGLIDLAYDLNLPLVATNDVMFADAGMFQAHEALLCIASGTFVGVDERRRLSPDHRFRSPAEMITLFADLPEAIANTVEIARRCAYRPRTRKPILPRFNAGSGRDEDEELKIQAERGLALRLEKSAHAERVEYEERLAFELAVITRMGFAGYFLIVADFIQWAKNHGIPVGPGRGSGAGSLVAYALTITDLDPLRFGLLFERFLNPERVSMPDFDIDFCQDRRDEVIHYVQDRYGRDQVAQIITFGKLQARAVLRDVGRVLQMPYGQVDRLCKMVPNNPANPVTLEQAIAGEPRLREERDREDSVRRLMDISLKLEGLYRHASTHAAGVVIGDRPLHELVPLYRDPRSDFPVTQFNMKWVEPAGLVKFDFLGLKTLTVLQRAVQLLEKRGITIDLSNLPFDDKTTFSMLTRGDTTGVFQLESSGMRDVLRRLKPDSIEDIIALVALYRPGPMDNIPKYVACKAGLEQPDYLYPSLEPVLKETYGVCVYQEQVMQIAQVLSGYSLGEADLLRRAMGKKIKAEMDAQKARFVEGAVAKGVAGEKAAEIFELVEKFAGYGFNKSHAAAYALVAYQTAYIKANFPVEFLAASMSLDLSNTDKLGVFRQELSRSGIKLYPPDVNKSEADFSVEDGAVRYALGAVRNVGFQAMAELAKERSANGPFKDLFDFARRMDPRQINRRALENLAKAGGFDSLNPNRAQVLTMVDTLIAEANRAADDRVSKQVSLFGGPDASSQSNLSRAPAKVDAWLPTERLNAEFEAIGFYLSAHPLDDYMPALRRGRVATFAELVAKGARGGTIRGQIAGTVVKVQERKSAKGNPFAFVSLSDPSGLYEVTLFSDVLLAAREHLVAGKSLVLQVEGQIEGDQPRLRAQGVKPVDVVVAANAAGGLKVFLDQPDALPGLKSRLGQRTMRGKGTGKVSLVLMLDNGAREVELDLPGAYQITPQVRGALKSVIGVIDVQEV
jgi:DNA polymerase-3 subunit alpha